jgi:hypothetical protein
LTIHQQVAATVKDLSVMLTLEPVHELGLDQPLSERTLRAVGADIGAVMGEAGNSGSGSGESDTVGGGGIGSDVVSGGRENIDRNCVTVAHSACAHPAGPSLAYRVAATDLDPKPLSRLQKWYRLDQKIVANYLTALSTAKRSSC